MNCRQRLFTYESKMIGVFFFVFGFMFLDQLTLSYLLPVITKDMLLSNAQAGQLGMWQTMGFAVSAPFIGYLSDRLGRRKIIIVCAMLGIALFSFLTLFVGSFFQLAVIRLLAGMSEGVILPVMYVIVQAGSTPGCFGRNVGLLSTGGAVLASTIGPVAMTQMCVLADWRMCYLLVCVPSLLIAFWVARVIRETPIPGAPAGGGETAAGAPKASYADLSRYRNVWVITFVATAFLIGMWTIFQFTPLYLTEVSKLPVKTMGLVISLFGLITIFWQVFIPAASDYLGRKPALIGSLFIGAAVTLVLFLFPGGQAGIGMLTLLGGNCIVLTPMIVGVIMVESVPPHLSASASSLVTGISQFISAFFLSVTGKLADIYGLQVVMLVAMTAYAAGGLVTFAMKESNPRKKRRINEYKGKAVNL